MTWIEATKKVLCICLPQTACPTPCHSTPQSGENSQLFVPPSTQEKKRIGKSESNELPFQRANQRTGFCFLTQSTDMIGNWVPDWGPLKQRQTPQFVTPWETVLLLIVTRGRKRLQNTEKDKCLSGIYTRKPRKETTSGKVLNTPKMASLLVKVFCMKTIKTERCNFFFNLILDYFRAVLDSQQY